jgi:REP element-mobilizing transposase RayT
MAIKEMSFGEDFAHVHMEVSIPNTMSISHAVQLLKGYSSYKVFKEMP